MSAENQAEHGADKKYRLTAECDKSPEILTSLQFIADTINANTQHVFDKALELGMNINDYRSTPNIGFFNDKGGYETKISLLDSEFDEPLEVINNTAISYPNIPVPQSDLTNLATSEVKIASDEMGIPEQKLLDRYVKVGVKLFLRMIREQGETIVIDEDKNSSILDYYFLVYNLQPNDDEEPF